MTRRRIPHRARNSARTTSDMQIDALIADAIRRGEMEMKIIDGEPRFAITEAGLERLAALRTQAT